jgi:hypothetical protein
MARHEPALTPNALEVLRARSEVELLGQRPRAPMRRVARLLLQRVSNHLLHLPVGDPARRAWPRLIEQPVEPLRHEPPTPAPGRLPRDPQRGCNLRVRAARRARQDDLRALGQALCGRPSPRPLLEHRPLAGADRHAYGRASSSGHPCLLVPEVREARRIRFRISDPGH